MIEEAQTSRSDDDAILADLLACPACDALHRRPVLGEGEAARCLRCDSVIMAHKRRSIDRVVPACLAALVSYVAAVTFPFLGVSEAGLSNQISVIDAVFALGESFGTLATITFLFMLAFPLWIVVSILLVTLPIRLGRGAPSFAAGELKLVRALAPWAMAEIFLLGTAVALIKVAGLASLSFGPAFFALGAFVLFLAVATAFLCEDTLWSTVRPV